MKIIILTSTKISAELLNLPGFKDNARKLELPHLYSYLRYQLRKTSVKVFEIAPPAADTELGHQNRADKSVAHGGIPVSEFIDESMAAIESDTLEAPIVNAKNIREQCEYLFDRINRP